MAQEEVDDAAALEAVLAAATEEDFDDEAVLVVAGVGEAETERARAHARRPAAGRCCRDRQWSVRSLHRCAAPSGATRRGAAAVAQTLVDYGLENIDGFSGARLYERGAPPR